MIKHTSTIFKYKNNASRLRYIQKYYLPPDLRSRIYPADIEGVIRCFRDERDLWRGVEIPEKTYDCVINYSDTGVNKQIDGETAHRIMVAYQTYSNDCNAELTTEEDRAARNLNRWLIEWEKQLLDRCIKINDEVERQLRNGDNWLTDYEMDANVFFYVRDDDPFSDTNMPDAWNNEIEPDIGLLCETTLHLYRPINAVVATEEDYWGIGDLQDHNELRSSPDTPADYERHCLTFHELYDHLHIPMKHMKRIGRVFTDIVVNHQNGTNIDLTGEQPIAVMDKPDIS